MYKRWKFLYFTKEEGVFMNETASIATVLEPLKTALVASITPTQIVTILAAMIGVGMSFVLMWFGVRKLISIFRKAVTRGKISV